MIKLSEMKTETLKQYTKNERIRKARRAILIGAGIAVVYVGGRLIKCYGESCYNRGCGETTVLLTSLCVHDSSKFMQFAVKADSISQADWFDGVESRFYEAAEKHGF